MRNNPVSIATTFGFSDVPPEALTAAFPKEHEFSLSVPKRDDNYVFRRESFRDLLAFLDDPDGDGFYLHGPFGCGKTTLPYQVAARLNWPISSFTMHARAEFDDLVGHYRLQADGSQQWIYGPLAVAMKYGHILVLNEIDRAAPGQLTGMHDVIEGAPLTIAMNGGERINPHENFRVIATGNSVNGDTAGIYAGVNRMDSALMDRFRPVAVDYPTEDIEMQILLNKAGALPEETRRKMIRVANEIRRLFIGGDEVAQPLTITMSTRSLCRWAKLTLTFRKASNPLEYALNQALLGRAAPEEQVAITDICEKVFADEWT